MFDQTVRCLQPPRYATPPVLCDSCCSTWQTCIPFFRFRVQHETCVASERPMTAERKSSEHRLIFAGPRTAPAAGKCPERYPEIAQTLLWEPIQRAPFQHSGPRIVKMIARMGQERSDFGPHQTELDIRLSGNFRITSRTSAKHVQETIGQLGVLLQSVSF